MSDFINAFSNPVLRFALLAGILSSVPFGIIGSFVVSRRITYIAGAISHSALGGIGIMLFLKAKTGMAWCDPIYGAVASAMLAALVIGLVSMYARQREDTVIGAIWAIGMSVGLLFIAKTPGYINAMSYLFGDILLIGQRDLYIICGLNVFIVVICILFYNKFLAICFDEEFASLRGIKVKFYYLLLLFLTALTIVLLVRIIGIVMVIALLTLPPAIAGHFSRRLLPMMIIAMITCMFFNFIGLGLSYHYDLPSGATIIVFAGFCYLIIAVGYQILTKRRYKGS